MWTADSPPESGKHTWPVFMSVPATPQSVTRGRSLPRMYSLEPPNSGSHWNSPRASETPVGSASGRMSRRPRRAGAGGRVVMKKPPGTSGVVLHGDLAAVGAGLRVLLVVVAADVVAVADDDNRLD